MLLAIALGGALGWGAAVFRHHSAAGMGKRAPAIATASRAFQCPMHTWVKSDRIIACTICGMDLAAAGNEPTKRGHGESDLVLLGAGCQRAVGVQTAVVAFQPLIRTLRVAGMIGEDESRHAIVSAPVEGRIDGLAMNCEGERIHIRQPIVTLFSNTLLAAAADYRRALKSGVVEADAARHRLEQLGLVAEQIGAIPTRREDDIHFGILAQVPGTILKSYVSEGQWVKAGEKLFEVSDFSKMWFVFGVYEQDLALIRREQFVNVHLASLPGEALRAKIAFINPNLKEGTRTAQVRVVLENPDGRIPNNTFAEGEVELDSPEVLTVPRSAVLWSGRTPRVIVERSPGAYDLRRVKVGRAGDSTWEIKEGLRAGECVVSAGNLLIDGQAQLEATDVVASVNP